MNREFVLSQTDGRPMYLQIMEQIKQRVAVGEWAPERRIPSIRELAVGLRVSVITVKRAYLELEREGVIVTRQGMGSFISQAPDLKADLHEKELEKCLETAVKLAALLGYDLDTLKDKIREIHDKKLREQK